MKTPPKTCLVPRLLLAVILIASCTVLPGCSGWEASTFSDSQVSPNFYKNSTQDPSW